ncbi:MAG: cobalamin biosynthesis protein CobQ [Paracoccaceae bacterium]|nr:cobalamin biosynthesis protein CobQ [Paracoccaceae bacterium]MDE2915404.1 cobalamin biosynthesis protein CobQ [Paracoccaceae bacterium]
MNTPTHLLIAVTAFGKPAEFRINTGAILGGLLPDLSLYAMAGYSLFILGNSGDHVFGTQYFSEEWQNVFRIDNSLFLWGGLLAAGMMLARPWLSALGGSGILHIVTDLPLHNDDARQHFWPATDWVFESPISYWDSSRYGNIVSVVEAGLCLVLMIVLVRRFRSIPGRALVLLCGAPQIALVVAFAIR